MLHTLGGSSIDIAGDRAIAQTKMTILQRGPLHGVEVDVACHGRFFDFLQRTGEGWKLRLRQPIYELDTLAPVEPGAAPALDSALLASFPEGYKHLGYLQSQMGFEVDRTLPGTRGPAVAALQARGRRWLSDPANIDPRGEAPDRQ